MREHTARTTVLVTPVTADRDTPSSTRVLLAAGVQSSGTAVVTRLLAANGADLGAPQGLLPSSSPTTSVPLERREVSELLAFALERLDAAWWAPPSVEAVEAALDDLVPQARAAWRRLAPAFAGSPRLIMDPRSVVLLPLWRQVLGSQALPVVCRRDPLSVARSLHARHGLEVHVGLALWEACTVGALRGLSDSRAVLVDVDELVDRPSSRHELVAVVRRAAGLPAVSHLDDTVDPSLVSRRPSRAELEDHLTGSQLALHGLLGSLPSGLVDVGPTEHLRVPPATVRVLDRNRRVSSELAGLRAAAGRPGELEAARAEVVDLQSRLDAQEQAVAQAEQEGDAARGELLAAQQALGDLQGRLDAARAQEQQATMTAVHWQAEATRAHATLAEAFASRSWRWTRALRRERRGRTPQLALTAGPSRELTVDVAPRVAVVAHVFYPELWQPLREQLANLQEPFDLFVSLTDGHSDDLEAEVLAAFPGATLRLCVNAGRDIAPFFDFVSAGSLDGYAAILKIHTKRSHHRLDGDEWRTALWHGLLPSPPEVRRFVDVLIGNPDVGCIVPEGSLMTGESLGSNQGLVTDLLARVGIDFRTDDIAFPAGSMYWLDGSLVELLKALRMDRESDFGAEGGEIDGTTAHAFERVLGVLLKRRGQVVLSTAATASVDVEPEWTRRRRPRVLALYLPQFHATPDNDRWWGEGFTEWRNVASAQAWHEHQSLPRRPAAGLGEYDLSQPGTAALQAKLASEHGVDGFLVYHYWFSGRRQLERPMDLLLESPEVEFPYALVWANENWTRTWDGLDADVLLQQYYEPGWTEGLFSSLLPHLRDPRYLRLDGRPLLVIFKPGLVPDLGAAVADLRALARDAGLGKVHVAGVLHDRHVEVDLPSASRVLDSWFECPPLSGATPSVLDSRGTTDRGTVYDYSAMVDQWRYKPVVGGKRVHPGAMPAWDNTPRRDVGASSFARANPADFRRWLVQLRKALAGTSAQGDSLVCLNAWNEWAETAYLEPDDSTGLANLEAVRSAFGDIVLEPS